MYIMHSLKLYAFSKAYVLEYNEDQNPVIIVVNFIMP